MQIVSEKLPEGQGFKAPQQKLVATIVHNAGIYNGILAGGLLWAAYAGFPANDVARPRRSGGLRKQLAGG